MFKKDPTPGPKTKLKSSAQRSLRARLAETYPLLEPHLDDLLPKRSQVDVVKIPAERVTVYTLDGEGLFYSYAEPGTKTELLLPHLKTVHKFPWAFQKVRIDRGAIRFVLSGATLMVPGLTSPGGRLPNSNQNDDVYGNDGKDLDAGQIVVVDAEGKENACLVGVLRMGTSEMKEKKKGVAIDNGHYLGDGLWKMDFS
ncbi:hypothetical protein K470DRAFT_277436 [Piedraia hortae CBS 480.64]|uniref:Translation machinery-associated protein 20 n=1 Tax=Piedraia hortae CBS 480.64 TaxID=1314780 RepID=A0A6A7BZ63_9PEZI|nr:hypothetical protein K470DRAFT_277436 [Piedraia hortae CBS 480.64]